MLLYNVQYLKARVIDGRELITSKNLSEFFCPAKIAEKFSDISLAVPEEIKYAVDSAYKEFNNWSKIAVQNRAAILEKAAYELENNKFELYALLIEEGGKSIHDAINEVIEAIDFCRYYANQAKITMEDKVLPGGLLAPKEISFQCIQEEFFLYKPMEFPACNIYRPNYCGISNW